MLLNSDTIVPPGFVERLATMARSAPNIGTVTPLVKQRRHFFVSNSERFNPMQSYEQIRGIDRAASTANAGDVIDVPSGIGFCLYVTRDCLSAVGGLSENFERGYLEDVDLCLRARARAFVTSARRRSMSGITARNPFSTRSEAWCFAIWTFWISISRLPAGMSCVRDRRSTSTGARPARSGV